MIGGEDDDPDGLAVARDEALIDHIVSRFLSELEDLEGTVHAAAGLAGCFGDVVSAGQSVRADGEVTCRLSYGGSFRSSMAGSCWFDMVARHDRR